MPTTKMAHPRRKTRYHIGNWATYDQVLVKRGSLTVWLSDEVLDRWTYSGTAQRGAQKDYSDLVIEAILTVKEIFHLPNRATEEPVRSLFQLLQIDLTVPDHTTLSRRGRTVQIQPPKRARASCTWSWIVAA